MNHFTKYCNKLFVGCTNAYCTFAHTPAECRRDDSYATKDVVFVRPDDANTATSFMFPNQSTFPRFVITLDHEDSDEEEDTYTGPSMSLSQVVEITTQWQNQALASARWKWMHTLAKEYHALTMNDEDDMDLSE